MRMFDVSIETILLVIGTTDKENCVNKTERHKILISFDQFSWKYIVNVIVNLKSICYENQYNCRKIIFPPDDLHVVSCVFYLNSAMSLEVIFS